MPTPVMNGTLTTAAATGASIQWAGGGGVFAAQGTSFGGGTLSLKTCSVDSATSTDWIPIGSGSNLAQMTAAGTIGFSAPPNWFVRAELASSANATIPYSILGTYGRAAAGV